MEPNDYDVVFGLLEIPLWVCNCYGCDFHGDWLDCEVCMKGYERYLIATSNGLFLQQQKVSVSIVLPPLVWQQVGF